MSNDQSNGEIESQEVALGITPFQRETVPMSWPILPLGSLLSAVIDYRGKTPPKAPTGIPTLTAANVKAGRIRLDSVTYVSEETYRRWTTRGFPEPNDVLITTEAPVGEVAPFPGDRTYLMTRRVIALRGEPSRLDQRFLLYSLLTPQVQSYFHARIRGSTVPRVLKPDILGLGLPVPPIGEQKAIAAVLGSLDDKIEQNRRTGSKLEGLARAVFKAWFVDFEPVKAKAAGATAFPGMPPETFAALPKSFTDSNLGPVPVGWGNCSQRVAELERAGTLLIGDGYRAKRSELADMGVPFIRAGNVNGTIITDGAELLGKPAIEKAGAKRSQVWDTVFTSKGTVGRIGLVTPATGDVVYAPQVCFWRATNREALSPFLLHLWMKSESFTSQWMSVKGQTDMADFVSLGDQRAMTMLVPPPEVQRGFDNIVSPIVELLAASAAESAKLAALRDYLLPRLLSGRLRVKALQGEVSNAS